MTSSLRYLSILFQTSYTVQFSKAAKLCQTSQSAAYHVYQERLAKYTLGLTVSMFMPPRAAPPSDVSGTPTRLHCASFENPTTVG